MKKVFFVMSTNDYSGAEAVNFSIIEKLQNKYKFYWVSRKGNINKFLKEKNIDWIEIKKLSISEIKRIVKENHPDILHATDYKSSVICSLANTKIKLIEHLHNNSPWLKKICLNSIAMLFAAFKSDKVLTVSDSIENEFIFSKFISSKIECIGNPLDTKKILSKVKDEDFKKKYDICCVARLTKQKNPEKFLEIIFELKKIIPNIKCIWVGSGELESECLEIVNKLNLNKNIKFVGFKKNPFKYMASSKIFMLTSSWEGFGLVCFEALSLGLPCFVSNVGGIPSIVSDDCGKLCNYEEEYIVSIKNVLKNDNLLKKLSNSSIKKSKKIENIDNYCNKIDLIYRS